MGGCNRALEESYLLDYSEYEAEKFTQGTLGLHIWLVKFLVPKASPISRYRESPNMSSFSLLRFSSMKP